MGHGRRRNQGGDGSCIAPFRLKEGSPCLPQYALPTVLFFLAPSPLELEESPQGWIRTSHLSLDGALCRPSASSLPLSPLELELPALSLVATRLHPHLSPRFRWSVRLEGFMKHDLLIARTEAMEWWGEAGVVVARLLCRLLRHLPRAWVQCPPFTDPFGSCCTITGSSCNTLTRAGFNTL